MCVGVLSMLGFFLYAMRPALQAWTMDLVPKEMGGTTVALMFGSQSLFAAVSPAIGGVLAGLNIPSWQAFVLPVAVLCVVAAIATWIPSRRALKIDPVSLLRAQ